MKVIEIFGNKESGQGMSDQQTFARPIADQAGESIQVVIKSALKRGSQEIRGLDDAAYLHLLAIKPRQIGGIAEIVCQCFDCGPWCFGKIRVLLYLGPARENLAAL